MNPCHQQLLGLLVDRVLPVAVEIGVRVRASRSNARPFRPAVAGEQPQIARRTLRGLQIVNPVEPAAAQLPAQGPPFPEGEGSRSRIDQHLIETAEPGRESGEGRRRQQRDMIGCMVPADRRERPQRLDKVAERAEPDHQDPAGGGRPRRRQHARPAARQRGEIDLGGQCLERGENRGMRRLVGRADRREQSVDQFAAAGRRDQRVDVARDDVAPVLVPGRLVPREEMMQRRAGRKIAGAERRDAMP